MYTKCECLRWILIDEGSSASCENLAFTESNVRTHTREAPETYKIRPKDKNNPAEVRSWGGKNLLMFIDLWQLPPVRQTAVFFNPFKKYDHRVERILNMFWIKEVDSMNKMIELTVAKRQHATDWFFKFITECRNGVQTEEMYNFIHGVFTRNCS